MIYHTYNDVLSRRPREVMDGDAYVLKIAAVVGHNNDVAYYIGDTSMSDEEVVSNGDKVLDGGDVFAYLMQLRKYRR